DPAPGAAGPRAQVRTARFGLAAHAARDEPTRRRIERNLPRREQNAARHDCLRIRPDGPRRTLCLDDLPHSDDPRFSGYTNETRILTNPHPHSNARRRVWSLESRVWSQKKFCFDFILILDSRLQTPDFLYAPPWRRSTSRTPGTPRIERMTLSRCFTSKTSTVTSMRPR